jgi:hypothetical protein
VTTLGSNRGKASVVINGGVAVTVNTHASTTTTSYIAYAGAYPNAAHTFTVKNLGGTTPRVDVDAFFWIGN